MRYYLCCKDEDSDSLRILADAGSYTSAVQLLDNLNNPKIGIISEEKYEELKELDEIINIINNVFNKIQEEEANK